MVSCRFAFTVEFPKYKLCPGRGRKVSALLHWVTKYLGSLKVPCEQFAQHSVQSLLQPVSLAHPSSPLDPDCACAHFPDSDGRLAWQKHSRNACSNAYVLIKLFFISLIY